MSLQLRLGPGLSLRALASNGMKIMKDVKDVIAAGFVFQFLVSNLLAFQRYSTVQFVE